MFRVSAQAFSETLFIISRIERVITKMYIVIHVKYPLFLSDFHEIRIFSTDFRITLEYQI